MINNITLTGRITTEPEVKNVGQKNTPVVNVNLAVQRKFKNASGEYDADFIPLVIFNEQAENFAKFNPKGSLIGVTGHIQTRSYENKDGQRVYVTEVIVDSFDNLQTKTEADKLRQQNAEAVGVEEQQPTTTAF